MCWNSINHWSRKCGALQIKGERLYFLHYGNLGPCDWNRLQIIVLEVQYTQKPRDKPYTHSLFTTLNRSSTISSSPLLPLTPPPLTLSSLFYLSLISPLSLSSSFYLSLSLSLSLARARSFRLLCPLPVQINTYCIEMYFLKRERQRNIKVSMTLKTGEGCRFWLGCTHRGQCAPRPRRTSFSLQWNNLRVVKPWHYGCVTRNKENRVEGIQPLQASGLCVCVCVPQIFPKRRHFKEQQEQLGEFTAPTFFYVSLPPGPRTPPCLSCYLRLQRVCFSLLHTTFKRCINI